MNIHRRSRFAGFLVASSMCCLAVAQESQIYEPLSDASIGRVFLSPQERARLDQLRESYAGSDPDPIVTSPAVKTGQAPAPISAGYIVNADGESRIWKNGDFVDGSVTGPSRQASFPGDVLIVRHKRKLASPPDADTAVAGESETSHSD